MKTATLALYGFAVVLLAVGLRELLTGFEENRCSMTYMFEYPEYRVRSRANISFTTSTPTFSQAWLQAAGCVAAEAAPSSIWASIFCLNLIINDRFLSSSDLPTPAKIRLCFLFFHSPVLGGGGLCVAYMLRRLNISTALSQICTLCLHRDAQKLQRQLEM